MNFVWRMHWNIIGMKPAYYLKLFWSMWCPKISSSRSLCKGATGSVSCQEWRNLWHCSISKKFHVRFHYFYFNMWVTSRLFYGSVGQMGQQVRPTDFQLWIGSYVYALMIYDQACENQPCERKLHRVIFLLISSALNVVS